jgi:hypothetical protein
VFVGADGVGVAVTMFVVKGVLGLGVTMLVGIDDEVELGKTVFVGKEILDVGVTMFVGKGGIGVGATVVVGAGACAAVQVYKYV